MTRPAVPSAVSPAVSPHASAIASPTATPPGTLDRAGLAGLVPHRGTMLLLDRLERWDGTRIRCLASDHRTPSHPLRSGSGLLAPAAIEMAAQAMALHGALTAMAAGLAASPGYLASVRGVEFACWRLDTLDPEPLAIEAERQAGDGDRILYAFTVTHGTAPIARGRAAVVLNTPVVGTPAVIPSPLASSPLAALPPDTPSA